MREPNLVILMPADVQRHGFHRVLLGIKDFVQFCWPNGVIKYVRRDHKKSHGTWSVKFGNNINSDQRQTDISQTPPGTWTGSYKVISNALGTDDIVKAIATMTCLWKQDTFKILLLITFWLSGNVWIANKWQLCLPCGMCWCVRTFWNAWHEWCDVSD